MIGTDEDMLVCDLAETYGILNYRSLPARTVATLSCGLRDSSRIKMKLAGEKLSFEQVLLINAYDRLNWLCWSKTKPAQDGERPPASLFERIMGMEEPESFGFATGEEYEKYRESILRGET